MPRGDLVMRAEVGDPAILDDQQPIGVEARRFALPCDMSPRIVEKSRNVARMPNAVICATVYRVGKRKRTCDVQSTSNGHATLSAPAGRGQSEIQEKSAQRVCD